MWEFLVVFIVSSFMGNPFLTIKSTGSITQSLKYQRLRDYKDIGIFGRFGSDQGNISMNSVNRP